MINKFTNPNAVTWWKWLITSTYDRPCLVFYFLSRKNSTSPRFFPLYNQMKNVQVVFISGTFIGKLDFLQLKFMIILQKFTKKKQKKYKWLLVNSTNNLNKNGPNLILNLDDPEFTPREILKIKNWENTLKVQDRLGKIVTTSDYIKNYLIKNGINLPIFVIEQGFSSSNVKISKTKKFSCVYSSPYIDGARDKHRNHPTWGVELFINEIIPKILAEDNSIEIHLIGKVGRYAKKDLLKYSQVKIHGLRSISESFELLRSCHISLYPRTIDNKRRVAKINEYLGADLPIVAFDLEDTSLVRELNIGILVKTVDNFVESVLDFKNNRDLYNFYLSNIRQKKHPFSWSVLAKKYDDLIVSDIN